MEIDKKMEIDNIKSRCFECDSKDTVIINDEMRCANCGGCFIV